MRATCDRCCARALMTITLFPSRGALTFCGHHGRVAAMALEMAGSEFEVVDLEEVAVR